MTERALSAAKELGLFSLMRLNWMWDLTIIKYIKILLQTGKEQLTLHIHSGCQKRMAINCRESKKRLHMKKLSNGKDDEALQQFTWTGCEASRKGHL